MNVEAAIDKCRGRERAGRPAYGLGIAARDSSRLAESLASWTWELTKAAWEEGYDRLVAFVEREGHSSVPPDYRDDHGYRLGTWVSVQRRWWKKGELSQERVRRLEALRGWTWEPHEAAWEDAYARLREFAEREGHSQVALQYRDDDGYRLGEWVINQRQFHRRGKLSQHRARRLEALPGWAWNARQANWEAGYARLRKFVERTGHSLVPEPYRDDDGFKLGQ